jgi:hypothetical protein
VAKHKRHPPPTGMQRGSMPRWLHSVRRSIENTVDPTQALVPGRACYAALTCVHLKTAHLFASSTPPVSYHSAQLTSPQGYRP